MAPDINDIMQAAERLIADNYTDGAKVTFYNFSRRKMDDLCELAAILPKGKRPVPVSIPDDDIIVEAFDSIYGRRKFIRNGRAYSVRKSAEWERRKDEAPRTARMKFYVTEGDAKLAHKWQLFDALAASP